MPAHAAGIAIAKLAENLKAMNLPADIDTSGSFPVIESGFGPEEIFAIYLVGCGADKTGCTSVQFLAGYTDSKAGVAEMNAFNNSHRFARGVIDGTGDPALKMDLSTTAMSDSDIRDTITLWRSLMTAFQETIFPE